MTFTAVALISASAVLHVLWNTLAKGRPTFAFLFYGNLVSAFTMLPIVILHASLLAQLPSVVWLILACTGVAQATYGFSLMRAYREEDLSIVYPLVRSLGPAFVVLGSIALGRGSAIGLSCLLGVAAIFVGSAILVHSNLRNIGKRTLAPSGLGFSLAAALGTMTYTLLDDAGVRRLLDSGILEALGDAPIRSGLLYASLEIWTTFLATSLWMMPVRAYREELRTYTSRREIRDAAFMGVGSIISYALVLIAMLYVSDVSYAAGFRQLSVPLGALIGVVWLGEHVDRIKGLGLLAMVIGLLAIAFA